MLHGGEIYGNKHILHDFSININPLGLPQAVLRRLAGSREILERYPDQECSRLRQALAVFTGLPSEKILCGNGASELIETALRTIRPNRVVLTAPSFSGYRRAAENCGAKISYHMLRREENFALTERFLEELERPGRIKEAEGEEMVILCSPANPVGNLIDPSLLEKIAKTCEEKKIWLMVDECFLGFARDEQRRTMHRFLAGEDSNTGCSRLLVLDAFTKRFAMPGIRLGYLMAKDRELLRRIHEKQPEWNVSGLAQSVGLASLEEAGPYMEKARELICSERLRMTSALESMGFTVFLGEANFIFFSVDPVKGLGKMADSGDLGAEHPALASALLEKGILIRDCSNYPGLGQGYYRAAIKRPEENDVFLQALKEIVCM